MLRRRPENGYAVMATAIGSGLVNQFREVCQDRGRGGQAPRLPTVAEAGQVVTQARPSRANRQDATRLAFVPRLQAAGGSGSRRLRPRPFDERFLRRLGFFDTGNSKRYAYR